MAVPNVDPVENLERMKAGEMYYAFTPDLMADRRRCKHALTRYNKAQDISRREELEMLNDILDDDTPLPRRRLTMADADDEVQLADFPIVDTPVKMDYGYNVKLGKNVYVNSNSTWIDTCEISVGARTLIGPNCSFYSGTHPLDPTIRNGIRGPESGKPIVIGEDCWLGGNVIVLPGVTIGEGSTVGAGSVVTKDVPPYHCVAGNPARIIRKIEVAGDGEGVQVLAGEDTLTV